MAFHVLCLDDPTKTALRQSLRAEHLEYIVARKDKLISGGPLRSDDGQTPLGAVYVLDADTRDEVAEFFAKEPYMQASLFRDVQIHRIAIMVPERHAGFLEQELERERQRQEVTD